MTNTALILVDIQNDYFPGGLLPLDAMESASRTAARVLADARKSGQVVVHIRHEGLTEDAPFFKPGSVGAQIHASIAAQEGEQVVLKHRPNSFHATNLREILEGENIETVTVIGAMSQMCIDSTVRAARDFGYNVTVIQDACAAHSISFDGADISASHVHATIMGALSGAFAKVVNYSDYSA